MPTDLFDLAAKITADTKDAEKSLTDTQKKVLDLANQFKNLDKLTSQVSESHKGLARDAGSAADAFNSLNRNMLRLSASSSGLQLRLVDMINLNKLLGTGTEAAGESLAGMAGPLGIAAAGMVATAAAAALLVKGLIDLGVSSAEFEGHLYDLSQQTGISAQMLSGFEVLSKTTGGNLSSLASSIDIFQRNLERAQDPTSKEAQLFQQLGITSLDTETAIKQASKALAAMPEGFEQTADAMALFGRGGKAFLAITKETNGNLDQMLERLQGLGVIVSNEDAKAADEFNDQLAIMGFQMRAVGATIGKEMLPPILSGLKQMESFVKDNQEAFRLLADAVRYLIAEPLQGFLMGVLYPMQELGKILNYLTSQQWTIKYSIVNVGGIPLPLPYLGSTGTSPSFANVLGGTQGVSMFSGLTGGAAAIGAGTRGGRGGGAKQSIDEVAQALEKQRTEIEEAIKDSNKYQKEIDNLVLSMEKKKKTIDDLHMAQLISNRDTLQAIEAEKLATDWTRKLQEEINREGSVTDEWGRSQDDVNKKLGKLGTSLSEVTHGESDYLLQTRRLQDALEKEAEAMQQLIIVRQRYADTLKNTRPRTVGIPPDSAAIDLGGGSIYMPDRSTMSVEDIRNQTRARRALPDYYGQQWQKMREQVGQITDLIARSIDTGFQQGMKAGLVEFAKGILQMIESKMLEKLADAITDAIMKGVSNTQSGGATTSGGGGWAGIAKLLIGGLGGIFGGLFGGGLTGGIAGGHIGGGTIGTQGHASGGLINEPIVGFGMRSGLIHTFGERGPETVIPGVGAPNVHITVYARDAQSFQSRQTQRQISEQYRRVMTKNALAA